MTIDFERAFDVVPVPLLVFDVDDYRILAANRAFFEAVHASEGDVIGKPFDAAFPVDPDDPQSFRNVRELRMSLDRIKERGEPNAIPLQRYTIPVRGEGDFEERYWTVAASPLCDRHGVPRYIVQRIEDVTDLLRDTPSGEQRAREARIRHKAEEALRYASEVRKLNEHLSIAQRVANVGSWQLNVRDRTRTWSEEMFRITGVHHDTPLNDDTVLEILHPDDRARFLDAHRQDVDGKNLPGEFEYRIIRPDNRELRHVRERIEISFDENRRPVWLYGTLQDITTYHEAEQKIHESEERFRMVARATADTIWDWNMVTGGIWWNEGIRTVFGYPADNTTSDIAFFLDCIHPDDRPRFDAAVRAVTQGDSNEWYIEHRFRRADGSYADVYGRGYIMRDEHGKAIRMVGGLDDVTLAKEREQRLSEQAELLDRAQDAIIVSDPENRITYWNRSAERLYGWKAEEVIGLDKCELLEVDRDAFKAGMRQVFEKGEWSGGLRQKRKNGPMFSVESAVSLVLDNEGIPKRILCVNTDVTERLALEEQLRQAQRLEAVGQLTGGIAHDFNNLLTVILGNAELVIDRLEAGSSLRKLATMTRDAAARGAELTHGLLAFARRQSLAPKTVDLNEEFRQMQGLLRRAVPEDIDIQVRGKAELWPAFVDPSQLQSVLLNLVLNAKDAMPDGGSLTIETDNIQLSNEETARAVGLQPGRYVMLSIRDTGTGIPPELLDKVFDPFFTTKEQGKGTGLGLSMAYGFARQSGGNIRIESEVGVGTTVNVYLPRSESAGLRKAAAEDTQRPRAGDGEKVLVVEDDDLVRTHAENQLEAFGYNVLSASDGPEALSILEKERDVDLLFTDVVMSGGMNGPELVNIARRIRPKLKVLYTSGYTENAFVNEGGPEEGEHLLQKPYQRADLAKKVRDALGQ